VNCQVCATFRFPFTTMRARPPPELKMVLSVLEDKSRGPFLSIVHCHAGRDGRYRIAHDTWPNQKALPEANSCAPRDLPSAMEQYLLKFKPESTEASSNN
jgi:hypothetical protein